MDIWLTIAGGFWAGLEVSDWALAALLLLGAAVVTLRWLRYRNKKDT